MAEARLSPMLFSLSGALGNLVFGTGKGGGAAAGQRAATVGAAAEQQAIVRGIMSMTTKAWQTTSGAQRTAWSAYAQHFFPQGNGALGTGLTGQALFAKANFYRLAARLPMQLAAPTMPPPKAPTTISATASANESTLTLMVRHAVAHVSGHRLFVEVTESMQTRMTDPPPVHLHAAVGINPRSAPPLVACGGQYLFTPLRSPLKDAIRFGLHAVIVSPEGVPSEDFLGTLYQSLT